MADIEITMTGSSGGLPADPAIPQLRRLACPLDAASLLDTVLTSGSPPWLARGEEPLDAQTVAVLRGHPGSRWTLRYTVRSRQGDSATSQHPHRRDLRARPRCHRADTLDLARKRTGPGAADAGQRPGRIAARHPERRRAVGREARTFVRTYQAAASTDERALAFYEALDCLRRAARLAKGGGRRRMRHAELLMAAAERALETGYHREP